MKFIKSILSIVTITTLFAMSTLAQTTGSISGQVVDSLGAVVVGATVSALGADGKQKESISNARGEYTITGLAPGTYTVRAIATNFALYENAEVVVTGGERSDLIVTLTVE